MVSKSDVHWHLDLLVDFPLPAGVRLFKFLGTTGAAATGGAWPRRQR